MKISRYLLVLGLFLFISAAGFYGFISLPVAEGIDGGVHDLSGYAWSSNIGWIRFDGSNYGIELSSQNEFEKYVWSSNIGWIRFNPVIGSGGDALPAGESGEAAELDPVTGKVTGWIRACSVFKDDRCAGNNDLADNFGLRSDSERGGWDGWIKMNPMNDPTYDVTYDAGSGKLLGFSWGADVVGWIDFCPNASDPTLGEEACVTVDSLNVQCRTVNLSGTPDFELDPSGQIQVSWETITPTDPSYTYEWTWSDGRTGSGPIVTQTYDVDYVGQPIDGTVTVTNSGRGSDTCVINISNPNTPQLNLTVTGGTFGKVITNSGGADPQPPEWVTSVGCRNNCFSTYLLTDTDVILTAESEIAASGRCQDQAGDPADCEFVGWTVNGSTTACSGIAPCTLDMSTGGKIVVAEFQNQGVPVIDVTINSSPTILRIVSHNSGQQAFTQPATISVTRTDGGDNNVLEGAQVCIDSFTGSGTQEGVSIYNIVGEGQRAFCDLGDSLGYCGQQSQQCTTLSNSNNYSTNFQIMIPDRSIALRDAGPYLIVLSINDVLGVGVNGQRELRFIYNIGGGGP